MKSADPELRPDASRVLGTAVLRAAEHMGLTRVELAAVLGRDRSSISRSGVDPDSKSGELARLLVRCYRSLAVMVDNNQEQVRHWLEAENSHTGGTPRDQLKSVAGLVTVCDYLDAIRGKV